MPKYLLVCFNSFRLAPIFFGSPCFRTRPDYTKPSHPFSFSSSLNIFFSIINVKISVNCLGPSQKNLSFLYNGMFVKWLCFSRASWVIVFIYIYFDRFQLFLPWVSLQFTWLDFHRRPAAKGCQAAIGRPTFLCSAAPSRVWSTWIPPPPPTSHMPCYMQWRISMPCTTQPIKPDGKDTNGFLQLILPPLFSDTINTFLSHTAPGVSFPCF